MNIPKFERIHEEGEDENAVYDVVLYMENEDCHVTVCRCIPWGNTFSAMNAEAKRRGFKQFQVSGFLTSTVYDVT